MNDADFPPSPELKWPRDTLDAAISSLTDQQLLILVMIADGQTNRSIAHSFGITEKTLEKHVARTFRALGVSGRVDAAVAYTVWRMGPRS